MIERLPQHTDEDIPLRNHHYDREDRRYGSKAEREVTYPTSSHNNERKAEK